RLRTVGIRAKLYGGGGDVVAHSSVYAPHGFSPAGTPRRQLRNRFHAKTRTAAAWMNAPTVSMKLSVPGLSSSGYVKMRLGIPSSPTKCMGKNVRFTPMKRSQKFHFPSRSSIKRPVIFGNQ